MPYLEIGSASSTLTSLSIISSGYIELGSSPATSGLVRFPKASSLMVARNNAGTNNMTLMETDSSDNIYIGSVTAGQRPPNVIIDASSSVVFRQSGTNYLTVNASTIGVVAANISFSEGVAAPGLLQTNRSADALPNPMFVRACGAHTGASAGANSNGGVLRLQGGTAKTDGSSGLRGGVRLELSSGGVVMAEVAEPAVGRRIVSLCRGSAITATELPASTGDLVVYIGNAATAPTANPVSGGILYCEGGALKYRGTSGTVTVIANA